VNSRIIAEFPRGSRERIGPAANFLLRQVFGDDESPATTQARARPRSDGEGRSLNVALRIESISSFF
jgi:hypothetical protein